MRLLLDTVSIKEYLRCRISEKRYVHSLNVSETASRLAEIHGADVDKACIAGLVHDCARELDKPQLLLYLEAEGIKADPVTLEVTELLHGPAAVHICRKVFGIEDQEVLNAVRYHTTGRENMTLLESIIYLSDFVEPSRCFSGVERIRQLAAVNMESALLLAINSSIEYLISKNDIIHTDTVLSRNYILKNMIKAKQLEKE